MRPGGTGTLDAGGALFAGAALAFGWPVAGGTPPLIDDAVTRTLGSFGATAARALGGAAAWAVADVAERGCAGAITRTSSLGAGLLNTATPEKLRPAAGSETAPAVLGARLGTKLA